MKSNFWRVSGLSACLNSGSRLEYQIHAAGNDTGKCVQVGELRASQTFYDAVDIKDKISNARGTVSTRAEPIVPYLGQRDVLPIIIESHAISSDTTSHRSSEGERLLTRQNSEMNLPILGVPTLKNLPMLYQA